MEPRLRPCWSARRRSPPRSRRGASLYSAVVFDGEGEALRGDVTAIVAALDWLAQSQVRLVNLSLAGPPNLLLEEAVHAAADLGMVLVAAAGNRGPDAPPVYPGGYAPVIAVAAVDWRGRPYEMNNRGPYVEIAAPGVDVLSARAEGGTAYWTGTSFATPFVTAALARALAEGTVVDLASARAHLGAAARDLGPDRPRSGLRLGPAPGRPLRRVAHGPRPAPRAVIAQERARAPVGRTGPAQVAQLLDTHGSASGSDLSVTPPNRPDGFQVLSGVADTNDHPSRLRTARAARGRRRAGPPAARLRSRAISRRHRPTASGRHRRHRRRRSRYTYPYVRPEPLAVVTAGVVIVVDGSVDRAEKPLHRITVPATVVVVVAAAAAEAKAVIVRRTTVTILFGDIAILIRVELGMPDGLHPRKRAGARLIPTGRKWGGHRAMPADAGLTSAETIDSPIRR